MKHSYRKIVVTIFLLIYCSKLAWYDLRVASARGYVSSFDISQVLVIWGLVLAPFIFYFLIKIPNKLYIKWYSMLYWIYIISSLIVGVLYNNNVIGLVGDFYKAFFIPAGIGLYFFSRPLRIYFHNMLFRMLTVFIWMRFILFVWVFSGVSRLYYGTVYDAVFFALALTKVKESVSFRNRVFTCLTGLLVLLGQKRVLLVSIASVLILNLRSWKVFLGALMSVVLVIIFQDSIASLLAGSRFASLVSIQSLIESQIRRTAEIEAIVATFSSNYWSLLAGYGFGAELDFFDVRYGGYSSIHSIHNSPLATLFRSGLLGVLVTGTVVIAGMSTFVKKRNQEVGVVIFAILSASLFVYSFYDEVLVGYFLGKYIADKHDI